MRAAPLLAFATLVTVSSLAVAQEENCPPGSSHKTESGLSWCEPSVCEADTNCPTGEVCREVPLCVEIGTMTGDAGKRLMVRQRCGVDKACPQTTTCSDMKRCVSRAEADKMAPPDAPPAAPPAKKSCGCHVPGAPTTGFEGAALAAVAIAVAGARSLRRRA
jgi:hypothetical protein